MILPIYSTNLLEVYLIISCFTQGMYDKFKHQIQICMINIKKLYKISEFFSIFKEQCYDV